jgi:hypothetical protein
MAQTQGLMGFLQNLTIIICRKQKPKLNLGQMDQVGWVEISTCQDTSGCLFPQKCCRITLADAPSTHFKIA